MEINDSFNKITRNYTYVNDLYHDLHKLSIAELIETSKIVNKKNEKVEKVVVFRYISSLEITDKNIKIIIEIGIKRLKIENEGFNTQKNHGYYIHHLKSKNVNAMKNHYLLIQIAHIIRQLYDKGIKETDVLKLTIKNESKYLLECFSRPLKDIELKEIETSKIQVRFL